MFLLLAWITTIMYDFFTCAHIQIFFPDTIYFHRIYIVIFFETFQTRVILMYDFVLFIFRG